MTVNKKELLNVKSDTSLLTPGVVGLSMASKKLLGENITDASSSKDTAKLAASTMLVK